MHVSWLRAELKQQVEPFECEALLDVQRAAGTPTLSALESRKPGSRSGREAALQKVAAGWCFPIDHFPRDEYARHSMQHEAIVDFRPADSARG